MTESKQSEAGSRQDLVVTRVVNAPIEDVWRMWTDPDLVRTWWGPQGYTAPRCEIDLRVNGQYLFCMRAPENQGGQEYYSVGTYSLILPEKRLEFTQSFSDAEGNVLPGAMFGMPDMPDEVRTVVTFGSVDGATSVTVTQFDQPADATFEHAVAGWNQSFDKMDLAAGSGRLGSAES